MIKPSERQSDRHLANTASDWKNSRLVVAVVSGAAVAGFMTAVIVPLTVSALMAKIDAMSATVAKAEAVADDLGAHQEKACRGGSRPQRCNQR